MTAGPSRIVHRRPRARSSGRAEFTPEASAAVTGVGAATCARSRASSPRARGGATDASASARRSSAAVASWLLYALNLVSGRLDEPGGTMFTTPAVDVDAAWRRGSASTAASTDGGAASAGCPSTAASCRSPRSPTRSRRRARVRSARSSSSAGNPGPVHARTGAARSRCSRALDFMVAIDPYLNETTRHADVILPPTSPLERSHYDVAFVRLRGEERREASLRPSSSARPMPATTGRSAWSSGRGSAFPACRSVR